MAEHFEANGLTYLEGWPGNSPDLNVIENCWVIVKRKIAALKPTYYSDLVEKVKQVWAKEITVEYCARLVESMPRRIAAVLAAKGNSSKY